MKTINYDAVLAQELISQIFQLSNFSEIQQWDIKAQDEVDKLNKFETELSEYDILLSRELEISQQAHKEKPFLKRVFLNDARSSEIMIKKSKVQEIFTKSTDLKERLNYWIDLTPNDEKEAKSMLNELNYAKKELVINKRELNSESKKVNRLIRFDKSQTSNSSFINPKLNRMFKIYIDVQANKAINSIEDAKSVIDEKINRYDRLINWIDRIRFS